MHNKEVVVSVEDRYVDRLPDVARNCSEAGMYIEQQLKEIGVITGTINPDKLVQLLEVPGVSRVQESREVGILTER